MTKLLHLTDPHLNFLTLFQLKKLCKKMSAYDGVVITGDIAEAVDVEAYLNAIRHYTNDETAIYFVCGNHDYYKGSIEQVRKDILTKFADDNFCWLGNDKIVKLNEQTSLVGHDGWYDGEYAPFERSRLLMSDLNLISELRFNAFEICRHYSQKSAEYIFNIGTKALQNCEHLFVATHVAPFPENSLAPNRRISDSTWMPYFSSKYMGEALLALAAQHPDKHITALCGHNHTDVHHSPCENLDCYTGPAKYGSLMFGKVFDL